MLCKSRQGLCWRQWWRKLKDSSHGRVPQHHSCVTCGARKTSGRVMSHQGALPTQDGPEPKLMYTMAGRVTNQGDKTKGIDK